MAKRRNPRNAVGAIEVHRLQLFLDEMRGRAIIEEGSRNENIYQRFLSSGDVATKYAAIWQRLLRRFGAIPFALVDGAEPLTVTSMDDAQLMEWLLRYHRKVLPIIISYLPLYTK